MKGKSKFKLKKMHFFSIRLLSTKILVLLVASVVLSAFITTWMSAASISSVGMQMAESEASISVNVLKTKIDSVKETMKSSANAIASDPDFVKLVKGKSKTQIRQSATTLVNTFGVQMCTITDDNGNVLARTHDPMKSGDNLSSQATVSTALKGISSANISSDEFTKLAVFSSQPILDSGKLIGTITIGYKLDGANFLDSLKETTGSEFIIFAGDERINTTLTKNGQRDNGTKLDSKTADVVLHKRQTYTGQENILGENYITCYAPILSSDGKTGNGVMFAGYELSKIEKTTNQSIRNNIFTGAGLILFFSIVGYYVIKKHLKQPLVKMIKVTKAIENGDVGEAVANELASINSRDEMGELSVSMLGAVRSLQSVSEDANLLVAAAEAHDLSVSVDSKDYQGIYKIIMGVIKQLFNEMSSIIFEIRKAAEQVSSGSEQVSAGAQALANGATEQASCVEELSATINDIFTHVKANAVHAAEASGNVNRVRSEIEISDSYMKDMVTAMSLINDSSGQIGRIIKTIEDIAFQTNILALNAAVEAARAGAAGKGFAVVANEVRNLASKSANAAKDTTALIQSSMCQVKNGTNIANDTAQSLVRVVESVKVVSDTIEKISQASNRQSDAIGQVSLGVDQISNVVQINSATAEESAAASKELSEQALRLIELVQKFKLEKQEEPVPEGMLTESGEQAHTDGTYLEQAD